MWKTELLITFLVLVFSSLASSFSLSAGVEPSFGKRSPTCPPFQEYRRCGPVCEHTCDTLREEVCCEVACIAGCFCADGYIRDKKDAEPKKCIPLHECLIPGYLELESAQLSVPEDIGFLQVKVLRREGHDGQIRMRYKTTPVTAQPNSDFSPTTGELIFEEGEDMKILKVDILDDTLREAPETFRIELFDPSVGMGVLNFRNRGSVLTTDVTIEDNDMIPGYLELESSQLRVPEDAGSLLIKVLRREGHDGQIRMRYRTVPVTAQPNSDFIPIEGELVFDDGEGMKVLKVDILDDTLRESPEQFRLELFEPSSGMGVLNFRHRGSVMRTDIMIEDND
ncbi:adhesion G-protein coupled receptor V1, partial [Trichonephila inaurata madagascariensis]